ncbi:pyridoxal-phosphate dependent enzyme [Thiomicrorhabdus sp.]|uniref:1-aminocyclopropane-1-carboxylate deaminase/D-cysteine desulfhydrase n=1 Tax=Thiomicrorhabdus sp. TaxID=2039724 RepID=UPI0029C869D5|nr:pyridoxal-phosphate dependent enzyme [Thiomicrorhabdus sp.]
MAHFFSEKTTPMVQLSYAQFDEKGLKVLVKRDDLNHPTVQGNKWHKLKLNLSEASKSCATPLITFGGAHSNHIAATAAVGRKFGIKTLGLIRGDELADRRDRWSPTLKQAQRDGMQLEFLSRQTYRRRYESDFLSHYRHRFPNAYFLPEGGSNDLAIKGLKTLAEQIDTQCPDWTHLYCAVGTGATLAGLIRYTQCRQNRQLIGVSSLKQSDYLVEQIRSWSTSASHATNDWSLDATHHYGGYGKFPEELRDFMQNFEHQFHILLDPVYTVKTFKAFFDDLAQDRFTPGSTIILLHSGGLQGRQNN